MLLLIRDQLIEILLNLLYISKQNRGFGDSIRINSLS